LQRRRRGPKPPFRGRQKKNPHRINQEIRVPKVRLVGENVETDVYSTDEARVIAQELELDLVEISPNADPPVCRIVDYQKFLYERKKKEKELKAKNKKQEMKEIRFGPNTDEHDFDFKLKHAEKFLQEGSKVKAYVHFRGRSIVFSDRGEMLLLRFAQELEEIGVPEAMPKLEGKRMHIILNPKTKKN
jgi:translation initiation factor IF-3